MNWVKGVGRKMPTSQIYSAMLHMFMTSFKFLMYVRAFKYDAID